MADDSESDRRKSNFFTTLPRILTAVAALLTALATVAGVFIFRDSDGTSSSTAETGNQVDDGPSSSSPRAEEYYTVDGSPPQLAPTCEGIFNLCLGTPVESAISLLGTEESRFGAEDEVNRQWRIGNAFITVGSNSVGAISSLTASLESEETDFRLTLPGALTLGESTMGQVLDQRGQPADMDQFGVEQLNFYEYVYCGGPEKSIEVRFGFNTVFGSPDDPGDFSGVIHKTVMSYSVKYGCSIRLG